MVLERMILSRREAMALTGACLVPVATGTAFAQSFPSRPVTLICPFPAGGPTDIVMRAMAEAAAKKLGQPVLIDNKAGATGTLGPATMAATAKPDGYTISQMPFSTLRLPLMQKTSFDTMADFTYILRLTGYSTGTIAKGDGPFKTWADVVAAAKANPGKLTYGVPGAASTQHIGMEQMAAHSGIKFTFVPFKGETEVVSALVGGHIDLMATTTGRQDMIDAGTIRILSIWTETRSKRLPDVPSIRELGYPFTFDSPWGFAGPKGMAPGVVKLLHDVFKAALDDPGVQMAMDKFDMLPRYLRPEDYRTFVAEQIGRERTYLDRVGLLKRD